MSISTATSRALVGMIFGLAMMGVNPDFTDEDRSAAVQAGLRMMFDGIGKRD